MFKRQKYSCYEEKIEKLKQVFGQFPPAFKPPRILQVSQGRTGSTELYNISNSLLENSIYHPNWEFLDEVAPEPVVDWNIESEGDYFYYNLHDIDIHRLHFPVFFWLLKECPKIIHLVREDHLKRAISYQFAHRMCANPDDREAIYKSPVNLEKLDAGILSSIVETEVLKKIIVHFVPEKRLLRLSYYDLYHTGTLNTLRKFARFLEKDVRRTRLSIGLEIQTPADLITNKQEIVDKYERTLDEKPYWIPPGLDVDKINAEIDEKITGHFELNTPQTQDEEMEEALSDKIRFNFGKQKVSPSSDDTFDLKAGHKFYIAEIPKSAQPIHWQDFCELPNLEQEIYLLDDRWDTQECDVPSWTRSITEVSDIRRNRQRDAYAWVCGFSVFFLKNSHNNHPEHEHRTLPETHDQLIRGVQELINYPKRCPETLLRFYVSAEVWERLAAERILHTAPNTEFYKMRYDSEESNIGATWRMLCLSDTEFEWAIETDCAPHEPKDEWIYERIEDKKRDFFKRWLSENGRFNWAGEFLLYPHNWDPAQGELKIGNIENFDFLSGGGIVTRPSEMPNVETLISRYVSERLNCLVYYHAGENVVCGYNERAHAIPHGWEGFGPDQEMWRFLKKRMPVRHLIHSQSTDHMKENQVPSNHFMKRLISQLISEGSEFADIETQEPIFNII